MNRTINKLKHYKSATGWRGVLGFLLGKILRRTLILAVKLPGLPHPVFVRLGTTDVSVLKQVLLEKHYDFQLPFSPTKIIDAGANIGLSAIYFAHRYPSAQIIAIEPEPSNFSLLQKNISRYPNITALRAALWDSVGTINLFDPGAGNHGFQTFDTSVHQSASNSVVTTDIATVLKNADWTELDLLKLDIEGSEKEVLAASESWIPNVGAIMIELHESFRPGCTEIFRKATSSFTNGGQCGESILVIRNDLIASK